MNGADPEGDPAPCGAVESVEISGGPDANPIDLAGVTAAAFPNAEFVSVLADDGADTVTGSALADEIDGEGDDDTIRGGAGNDVLNGSDGDDRVFGGAASDTITAAVGNDSLDGQAGSDTYQLDLDELGPSVRIADTGTDGTDAIDVADCEGVTVEAGRISFEQAHVTVSGIESYPCGFTAPPAPPAPPPAGRDEQAGVRHPAPARPHARESEGGPCPLALLARQGHAGAIPLQARRRRSPAPTPGCPQGARHQGCAPGQPRPVTSPR